MGGIVEGGVGIDTKTSPRRAAIDKAQAELRLEYDICKERRRELEFLEKGGNPLDFKFGITDPLSVHEARVGFSSAASPLGDSIGSSGRLGATVACEPNGADNFDGENEISESKGKLRYASRSNNTPSEEHSSQLSGGQNVRESEDSPIFHPKRAYRRRNRSKTNRDSGRLGATDISSHGGHNYSLSDHHRVLSEAVVQESPCDTEMDCSTVAVPTNGRLSEGKDMSSSKQNNDDPRHQLDKKDGVLSAMTSVEPDPCMEIKKKITGVGRLLACSDAGKFENDVVLEQQREPDRLKGDGKYLEDECIDSNRAVTLKGLDTDISCTQTSGSVDGNADSRLCSMKNIDSIEEQMEQKLPCEVTEDNKGEEILKEKKMEDITEINSCINDGQSPQSCQANGFPDQNQEETEKNHFSAPYEAKCFPIDEDIQAFEQKDSKVGLQQGSLHDSVHNQKSHSPKKQQEPHSIHELSKTDISCSVSVFELQLCGNQIKEVDKAQEDQILEKAQNIQAKRKIIEDLSLGSLPTEYRGKTHWDFVLEEMAWMANDFAQERVWKRTSATQLCYRAAFASRLRFGERDRHERDRVVARTMAKAVMDFWHSAALLPRDNVNVTGLEACGSGTTISENMDSDSNTKVETAIHNKEYVKDNIKLALQGYAVRFLQFNSSAMPFVKDATSLNPEEASTIGTYEMTYQNQHAEEDLFYAVPHGAMECYRNSVEKHMVQCLRAGRNIQEEDNSSMYNAEFEYHENVYEEDEGENAYYLPGAFEGSKAAKFPDKKRKNVKLYTPSSYEMVGDLSYGRCIKNRIRISQSSVKRPANGIDVCPIPTKRIRTASRQRVVGPFSSGPAGFTSAPSRTDPSSGDTNSFQDDESTLHGGSVIAKGLEVESGMDYDKQSAFDCAEYTAKPKKKKTKHQRNYFKKRSESHQLDSNSNYDPFVPQAKKPKIMKQSLENSIENKSLMSGSVASPVGSQMSNMSNPNKLIKLIGGRDRGRKAKTPKALVVLVHDMGPNWELVSDAISSTLHFKGGARQLFQQLRGPMEEDTIKSHFEKIISIGQQLHGRKKQDPKQLVSMHSSHLSALSQVMPSVNGGILTPLDLCDMAFSTSPDVFSGSYQNPHSGSLLLPNEASSQTILPSSTSSSLQGPPGSNRAIPSAQVNVSVRDGRHGISRANIPIDEHQRIQQYKQMLSSRNLHQSNMSVPGTFSGNDQGGRILPGGNGMSMPRPGLQGNMVGSPSSLNVHPRASAGQGMSMLRPRDASMMRVSHGNSRGVPSISGSGSSFSSHSASPSGPMYPAQQQQQHIMHQKHSNPLSNSHYPHLQGSVLPGSTEQQALAMSHARDRQLQHRMLQRQQQKQQLLPTQSQLSVSTSSLQNSSQIQSQATSQPVTVPPISPSSPVTPAPFHHQQKLQLPRVQTAQTTVGRMMTQSGRHHPPQRQPPQSQQQAKLAKVMGRGNTMMLQHHHPMNSSHLNGLSNSNPGSHVEKGEKSRHSVQEQVHSSQSSKPCVPPPSTQSRPQQSNSNQGIQPPIITPPNQQVKARQHPPVKLVNPGQPHIRSAVSQNHATNFDRATEGQTYQSQSEQQLENDTSPMKSANIVSAGSLNPNPHGCRSMSNLSGSVPVATGAHGLAPKKPPNSLASSIEISQPQTTLPDQVLPHQKHQQYEQLVEQSSKSNTMKVDDAGGQNHALCLSCGALFHCAPIV
ncbi:hypothetical protein V2J09_018433 [Rumex salicifolius]